MKKYKKSRYFDGNSAQETKSINDTIEQAKCITKAISEIISLHGSPKDAYDKTCNLSLYRKQKYKDNTKKKKHDLYMLVQ